MLSGDSSCLFIYSFIFWPCLNGDVQVEDRYTLCTSYAQEEERDIANKTY